MKILSHQLTYITKYNYYNIDKMQSIICSLSIVIQVHAVKILKKFFCENVRRRKTDIDVASSLIITNDPFF